MNLKQRSNNIHNLIMLYNLLCVPVATTEKLVYINKPKPQLP